MFFDYNEVSDNLTCPYCSHRFTDVVKLVPQCGNSICGDCYEALMSDLDESREFKCKLCDNESHHIPTNGLPNNKMAMKLIKLERIEKPLNAKTKTLKTTIEDVQQRIEQLQSYDGAQEVNTYCNLLEDEVTISVESSIKHLNKLKDELLAQINGYRKELLDSHLPTAADLESTNSSARPDVDKTKKELEILSESFDAFNKEWTEYFVQLKVSRNDEEIEKAQKHANNYKQRAVVLEKAIRDQTFNNKFMIFDENPAFCLVSDHLGKLDFQVETRKEIGEFRKIPYVPQIMPINLKYSIPGGIHVPTFFGFGQTTPVFSPFLAPENPTSSLSAFSMKYGSTASIFGSEVNNSTASNETDKEAASAGKPIVFGAGSSTESLSTQKSPATNQGPTSLSQYLSARSVSARK